MNPTRTHSISRTRSIGAITVKAGRRVVRVVISNGTGEFTAAAMIAGSVWYESARTGIEALLQLAARLEAN